MFQKNVRVEMDFIVILFLKGKCAVSYVVQLTKISVKHLKKE
jgi:hypothetical protein